MSRQSVSQQQTHQTDVKQSNQRLPHTASHSHQQILQLQKVYGNRAVQGMFVAQMAKKPKGNSSQGSNTNAASTTTATEEAEEQPTFPEDLTTDHVSDYLSANKSRFGEIRKTNWGQFVSEMAQVLQQSVDIDSALYSDVANDEAAKTGMSEIIENNEDFAMEILKSLKTFSTEYTVIDADDFVTIIDTAFPGIASKTFLDRIIGLFATYSSAEKELERQTNPRPIERQTSVMEWLFTNGDGNIAYNNWYTAASDIPHNGYSREYTVNSVPADLSGGINWYIHIHWSREGMIRYAKLKNDANRVTVGAGSRLFRALIEHIHVPLRPSERIATRMETYEVDPAVTNCA